MNTCLKTHRNATKESSINIREFLVWTIQLQRLSLKPLEKNKNNQHDGEVKHRT